MDGTDTDLATIDASGQLIARQGGVVRVTARVKASNIHAAGSISHTVTLTRIPVNLTFGFFDTSIRLARRGCHPHRHHRLARHNHLERLRYPQSPPSAAVIARRP